MVPISILVAGLDPLFAGVLSQRLQYEDDMVVVDRLDDEGRLSERLEQGHVDVVLVSLRDGAVSTAVERVLYTAPRVVVIAIGTDGREAAIYELRPQLVPIASTPADLSTDSLLDAIRGAVEAKVR